MKALIKVSLAAAVAAMLSSGAAFADDQRLELLLPIQRNANPPERNVTVGVLANGAGVGAEAGGDRYSDEDRRIHVGTTPHGQVITFFVPRGWSMYTH